MRIYIHKRSLEAALYELVEDQNEKLLEILTQIVNFRLNKKGCARAEVEKLLFVPARIFCYILDFNLTGTAFYLMCQHPAFLNNPLSCFFVVLLGSLWTFYLAYEGYSLFKIKKEAFQYVLIDELIARKMLQIGMIVS